MVTLGGKDQPPTGSAAPRAGEEGEGGTREQQNRLTDRAKLVYEEAGRKTDLALACAQTCSTSIFPTIASRSTPRRRAMPRGCS